MTLIPLPPLSPDFHVKFMMLTPFSSRYVAWPYEARLFPTLPNTIFFQERAFWTARPAGHVRNGPSFSPSGRPFLFSRLNDSFPDRRRADPFFPFNPYPPRVISGVTTFGFFFSGVMCDFSASRYLERFSFFWPRSGAD